MLGTCHHEGAVVVQDLSDITGCVLCKAENDLMVKDHRIDDLEAYVEELEDMIAEDRKMALVKKAIQDVGKGRKFKRLKE